MGPRYKDLSTITCGLFTKATFTNFLAMCDSGSFHPEENVRLQIACAVVPGAKKVYILVKLAQLHAIQNLPWFLKIIAICLPCDV